jgi:hypothetical protein
MLGRVALPYNLEHLPVQLSLQLSVAAHIFEQPVSSAVKMCFGFFVFVFVFVLKVCHIPGMKISAKTFVFPGQGIFSGQVNCNL